MMIDKLSYSRGCNHMQRITLYNVFYIVLFFIQGYQTQIIVIVYNDTYCKRLRYITTGPSYRTGTLIRPKRKGKRKILKIHIDVGMKCQRNMQTS